MRRALVDDFLAAVRRPDVALATAALRMAWLEYPRLDPALYLARLDEMGREAESYVRAAGPPQPSRHARVKALGEYLFGTLGFSGNRAHYEDPRNSFLNEVLDRRTGIPITLAVVFLEVGARAGVRLEGVNFPGHFLVRAPAEPGEVASADLLIDPFHGGAVVAESDCSALLRAHLGDDAELGPAMFAPAAKPQIVVRMLLNLKRSYVRMRSFPLAREVTELLLELDPSSATELRDRGLLAYHLEDFAAALRDLQRYLQIATPPQDDESKEEREQIWEHVKNLRKRIASFN